MLKNLKRFLDGTVLGHDGPIGPVSGFYFDDRTWIIRYLVVKTDFERPARQILIAPSSLTRIDWHHRAFRSEFFRDQTRHCPEVDFSGTSLPPSLTSRVIYRGFPLYWEIGITKLARFIDQDRFLPRPPEGRAGDAWIFDQDLAKVKGKVGTVTDFVFDDRTYRIHYAVVETAEGFPHKRVLVSPENLDTRRFDFGEHFCLIFGSALYEMPMHYTIRARYAELTPV